MKLIIDIDEKVLEHIKTQDILLSEIDVVCESITNGTPYDERPQGDLISREALKKVLFIKFGNQLPNGLFDEIDNAPTINTEDCEGCPYCPNSNSGIPIGVE